MVTSRRPRIRRRGLLPVGADEDLEHYAARLAYARSRAEVEDIARSAFARWPDPGPQQQRIRSCLRLHHEYPTDTDRQRELWRERA